MSHKVILVISKTGDVSFKLEGFAGQGCTKVADDVVNALGTELKREKTPEYYLAGGAPEGVLVQN